MSKVKKLYRSQKDFVLSGVCGGVAEYFDVDSMFIRLIALILIFSGAGLLVYILMWIIVPFENEDKKDKKTVKLEKNEKNNEYSERKSGNFREFLGLLLIVLGILLLIGRLFSISPEIIGILILIVVGILFLVTSSD